MLRYVARRLAVGVLSLVIFTFVMFVLVEVLIPGDYVTPSRLFLSGQEIAELRAKLGLDRPLPVRYALWLKSLVTEGFGSTDIGTIGGNAEELASAAWASALVFVTSLGIAYLLGSWLGRVAAWRRRATGVGLSFLGVFTYTLFPPFVGFLLGVLLRDELVVARKAIGATSIRGDERTALMATMALTLLVASLVVGSAVWWVRRHTRFGFRAPLAAALVAAIAGGYWASTGVLRPALDVLVVASVPTLAFIVLAFGDFLLVMRTSMEGVLTQPYIQTAQAKGLAPGRVRDRHAGPNAVPPVLARFVVGLPYLLAGLVIIESAVGWEGLGSLLFAAIDSQNMPLTMDILVLVGGFTVVVRIVAEVLQAALDPRIGKPA